VLNTWVAPSLIVAVALTVPGTLLPETVKLLPSTNTPAIAGMAAHAATPVTNTDVRLRIDDFLLCL